MRQRPIRSQLYLPILRFGITDEDWGFVILAGVIGYAAPYAIGLEFFHLPAELIGWLLTMGLSVLALNVIRRKSRRGWLKHTIQSRLRGTAHRRWLPGEVGPDWLKAKGDQPTFWSERTPSRQACILNHQQMN